MSRLLTQFEIFTEKIFLDSKQRSKSIQQVNRKVQNEALNLSLNRSDQLNLVLVLFLSGVPWPLQTRLLHARNLHRLSCPWIETQVPVGVTRALDQ